VEKETAHLLEAAVGAQIENVVPPIDEHSLRAVDIADFGLTGYGPFQTGTDGALDRPIHMGSQLGFRLEIGFPIGLFLGLEDDIGDTPHRGLGHPGHILSLRDSLNIKTFLVSVLLVNWTVEFKSIHKK
jgi:hypothetical protein